MVHCWATDKDDPTEMPRWGKIGKQKIEDAGTLYPKRMETVDDEIRDLSIKFIDKAKKDNKPFFVWLNPTRMHIVTHLSPKYEAMRNSDNGWSEEEAGMAQLDDDVGIVMNKLKDMGVDDNTIVLFTTDNGTEVFTWPDGGQTPFAQSKGTVMEGGFRVPALLRWPGHVPADSVQNGIFSGMDWLPTFVAAAGNPNITDELLKGKTIGDRTYKNHLDGYNQMAAITGQGPSNRHEIFYLGESTVGAVRIDDYGSSTNPKAGWVKRPIPTFLISPTYVSIRSSVRAGRATERKTGRSNTSIGSSTSSGALCSSRRSWAKKSRPPSISRRCSTARASTLTL
jgi:arylsulfatase